MVGLRPESVQTPPNYASTTIQFTDYDRFARARCMDKPISAQINPHMAHPRTACFEKHQIAAPSFLMWHFVGNPGWAAAVGVEFDACALPKRILG